MPKPHFLTPLLEAPNRPHVLRNTRTGQVVAGHIVTAFDSRTRRRGLLNLEAWPPGHAMILAPCSVVHTAFMRFPIDAIFVRRDGRVARASSGVRPWRVCGSLLAFAVVEMREGSLAGVRLERGDVLEVGLVEGVRCAAEAPPGPDISRSNDVQM